MAQKKVYRTREDYAREVWASLDAPTQQYILTDYGINDSRVMAGQAVAAPDDEFFAAFADNMDARNNGTVHFTSVDDGYTVMDETDPTTWDVEGGE